MSRGFEGFTIKELVAECKETDSVGRIVELSRHDSPLVRLAALKQVCPCRVKADIDAFWDRVVGERVDISSSNVVVRRSRSTPRAQAARMRAQCDDLHGYPVRQRALAVRVCVLPASCPPRCRDGRR